MTREEAIKIVRNIYQTDAEKEALEAFIPELAESEDERIRKALVEYFAPPVSFTTVRGISVQKVRDWLERQKEQNGEDGFLEDELSAFLQNYDKEYDDDAAVSDVARHFYEIGKKQNEQKPHTDEEKEYIRTIKSIISDFIRDKKPENLAYYQRIYDWLDGRHVPFSCGHENGKPAEWCRTHGYQPTDSITVRTFIEQTRNDYGGDAIRELAERYGISPIFKKAKEEKK